jgi:hypothetical protein
MRHATWRGQRQLAGGENVIQSSPWGSPRCGAQARQHHTGGSGSQRDGDGRGRGSPALKHVLAAAGSVVVSVGSGQDLRTWARLGVHHDIERRNEMDPTWWFTERGWHGDGTQLLQWSGDDVVGSTSCTKSGWSSGTYTQGKCGREGGSQRWHRSWGRKQRSSDAYRGRRLWAGTGVCGHEVKASL